MASPAKTPDPKLRLLLVDQGDSRLPGLQAQLGAAGNVELQQVDDGMLLREMLLRQTWDALLCAHNVPGLSLQTVQRQLTDLDLDVPLLILADSGDEKPVIRALKNGARDCLTDRQLERLLPALEREVNEARLRADHRAALEMLKGSENRFRALAANLPGMAFQLARGKDGQLRFLYVSEGGHKLLGLKPHELLGSANSFGRLLDVIDPEDRPALEAALAESAAALTVFNWEGRIRPRNQQKAKWVNLRSSPLPQEDGSLHWHGIATDITRSKETETALRKSREQLAELSSYLEAAKEEERERIARDIHDELGSILVAAKIETALLAGKLPDAAEEENTLRKKALSIEALVDQAMGTASRVARELRPGILKEFGLQAAIECQAEDFAQRTGITCRFQCEALVDGGGELDEATSLALFRIVQ
ncbi:MAG: PAS domain S-box protein, partial [Rhodocyclaceae bacterium]